MDLKLGLPTFENRCLGRLLWILYWEYGTNDFVWSMVTKFIGLQELLAGGQRKNWITNMKEQTGHLVQDLFTITQDRPELQILSAVSIHVFSLDNQFSHITGARQWINE